MERDERERSLLVVEDDDATRSFLVENLTADGFRVAAATGAGEGGWQETLAVADGTKTIEAAKQQAIERMRVQGTKPETLVGIANVARMLGYSTSTVKMRVERGYEFPAPAVVFKGVRGWLVRDIEAHDTGKPYPKREPNELRSRYLSRADIAKRSAGLRVPSKRLSTRSDGRRCRSRLALSASARIGSRATMTAGARTNASERGGARAERSLAPRLATWTGGR